MFKIKAVAGACALAAGLLVPMMGAVPGVGAAGSFAYSTQLSGNGGCTLVKIDLATAVVSTLGADPSSDACVSDLAVTADGTPWGIGTSTARIPTGGASPAVAVSAVVQLVEFDPTTGAVTNTTELPDLTFLAAGGIAVGADGTVYIHAVSPGCDSGNSVCLFTVDPATGSTTAVGPASEVETTYYYLANCDGLVSMYLPDGPQFVDVSSSNGATTDAGVPADFLSGYDCAGTQRFALEGGNPNGPNNTSNVQSTMLDLVTFDPATGATDLVAAIDPSDANLNALALVPEVEVPTTTTTAPTTTTTAPAVQSVTAQPKFTG